MALNYNLLRGLQKLKATKKPYPNPSPKEKGLKQLNNHFTSQSPFLWRGLGEAFVLN
jgi:hypothetical protein